ncbi:hypothetical protein IMZ29_00680 [Achromobacter sp. GG226]|uniref:hypothetical protein n=1 Tax=Verticiella alkaliphila TaxID=2779529 RepID=UPI001C0E27C4|nr:hypothetical protein [Verticiella sp. GG226]MBU4609117.1 hypothetical protein [Verticiella sp. GG226]
MVEILSGISGWLGAALAVLVALVGTWIAGRRSGSKVASDAAAARQAERDRAQAESIQRNVEERRNAEIDAARLPDGGAADRLRDHWARD